MKKTNLKRVMMSVVMVCSVVVGGTAFAGDSKEKACAKGPDKLVKDCMKMCDDANKKGSPVAGQMSPEDCKNGCSMMKTQLEKECANAKHK